MKAITSPNPFFVRRGKRKWTLARRVCDTSLEGYNLDVIILYK